MKFGIQYISEWNLAFRTYQSGIEHPKYVRVESGIQDKLESGIWHAGQVRVESVIQDMSDGGI